MANSPLLPLSSGLASLALLLCVGSCVSARRPVLYPNAHFQQMGDARAQADIDECLEFAAGQVQAHRRAQRALEQGSEGALVGGVGGAAVGAVSGGGVGRGAGVGAVAGAAVGVVHGLWEGSEPDPLFKRFVEQCLRDKGYDPKGWR